MIEKRKFYNIGSSIRIVGTDVVIDIYAIRSDAGVIQSSTNEIINGSVYTQTNFSIE